MYIHIDRYVFKYGVEEREEKDIIDIRYNNQAYVQAHTQTSTCTRE